MATTQKAVSPKKNQGFLTSQATIPQVIRQTFSEQSTKVV